MQQESKVRVIINDRRFVPTIGKGPVLKPIYITTKIYNLLKLLKYDVSIYKETESINKFEVEEHEIEKLSEEKESSETEVEDEDVEEVLEESSETEVELEDEEVLEEISEPEEELEELEIEEVLEKDINKMTKKELKELLDSKEIKYNYNANVSTLRELLIQNL